MAHKTYVGQYPDYRHFGFCRDCRWKGTSRRTYAEADADRKAHEAEYRELGA